jgi:glutamate-1-semialdehyde 2,1-aminomutase
MLRFAIRATLADVMTDAAHSTMFRTAARLETQLEATLAQRGLSRGVIRTGACAEFQFARPPQNGTADGLRLDDELEQIIHRYLLDGGVPVTPFRNMTLVCSQTSEPDVARPVDASGACLDEIV